MRGSVSDRSLLSGSKSYVFRSIRETDASRFVQRFMVISEKLALVAPSVRPRFKRGRSPPITAYLAKDQTNSTQARSHYLRYL